MVECRGENGSRFKSAHIGYCPCAYIWGMQHPEAFSCLEDALRHLYYCLSWEILKISQGLWVWHLFIQVTHPPLPQSDTCLELLWSGLYVPFRLPWGNIVPSRHTAFYKSFSKEDLRTFFLNKKRWRMCSNSLFPNVFSTSAQEQQGFLNLL